MKAKRVFLAFAITGFWLFAAVYTGAEDIWIPDAVAPQYRVLSLVDPLSALANDARFLSLDIGDTNLEENRLGWWIRSNDEFEIRRHVPSGYFTYINKTTDWNLREDPQRPVDTDDLKEEALSLLEGLGVPRAEVYNATVHRLMSLESDEDGRAIGEPWVCGFLVYVLRQIGGVPVVGSTCEVVYDARGNLHKINTSWRPIAGEPIGFQSVVSAAVLAAEGERLIQDMQEEKPSLRLARYHTMYAFKEAPYQEEQTAFDLQYVITYRFEEGFFQRVGIPAVK